MTGRIIRTLRGTAFWTTAALLIVASMLVALPVCWRRSWACAILRGGFRIAAPVLLRIAGVTVRCSGAPPTVLASGGYILISNHSSNLDVLCLERATGYPGLSVVIKSEVSRMPVIGWYLRGLGWAGVDRGKQGAAERLIDGFHDGRRPGDPLHVLIFPEGTRTRDGALQRFRLGPFLMALQLQLPIVPAIIRGARACHPRGALGFRAGTVSIDFAVPLVPPPLPAAVTGSSGAPIKEHARLAQELQRRARALYENIDLDRAS